MSRPNDSTGDWTPRRPAATAVLCFALAALALCWPMLQGKFIAGPWSDQFEAGYSFRHFAAEYFRQYGSIPQWNPYLFAGLPFVGAAHGDIFYPTALLRLILPTDVAMNLGFALHLVFAGWAMYGLMRTLRVTWGGSLVAGLGYQLTGIVASLVHPGHDGKLFVSAVTPLLFMGIVRAVRDRSIPGYGIIALATGLALQGHPQASYYLLVAGAVWGVFWVFGPEGPTGPSRPKVIAAAAGAVALGVGLYAIYALPMAEYVPYSPRAAGGYNSGWEYATSFSLPASELLGLLMPLIDGGTTPHYFGANGLKLHTEYLGAIVLMLAALGMVGGERRRVRIALAVVAGLFLLVSLGGSTPFFRLWYAVMPLSKSLRAPGMAFFLVAMPVAAFAGFGAERLFRGEARLGGAWVVAGVAAVLGILGITGLLQNVAEDISRITNYFPERAIANAEALRADALRLLVVTAAGAGVFFAIQRRMIGGAMAVAAVALLTAGDLAFVVRKYFEFSPGASVTYAKDPIMAKIAETPMPYRTYAPAGPGELEALNPYPKSWLMAAGIPTLFGYHGNELRTFDDLLGGKNLWKNQLNPAFWNLFAIRFVVLTQPQEIPGYHQILGPAETFHGPAYLYEADTIPPYARVMTGAAKIPDADIVPTVSDPRFPVDRVVIYADTASVNPEALDGTLPAPSTLAATVTAWRPGRMEIAIEGSSAKPEYLVVAENWYHYWTATVDGQAVPVHRAQNTLLSVVLPPGAKTVTFTFDSSAYRRGRLISLASMLGVLALFVVPLVRSRRSDG